MPKSNTRKLNDTQLVILSSASQRDDGFAVLPEAVRAASGKAAVIRLSKLGFLKQVRVKRDQPHWLTDEEGKRTRPPPLPQRLSCERRARCTAERLRLHPNRSARPRLPAGVARP